MGFMKRMFLWNIQECSSGSMILFRIQDRFRNLPPEEDGHRNLSVLLVFGFMVDLLEY